MMTIEVSDFVIGFVWMFFDEGRFNYRLMIEFICFIVMLQDFYTSSENIRLLPS